MSTDPLAGLGPNTSSVVREQIADQIKVARLEVKPEAVVRAFPDAVKWSPDGKTFEAELKGKQILELNEMKRPARRAAIEARLRQDGRTDTIDVETVRGETHRMPVFREAAYAARGELRPVRGRVLFLGKVAGNFCDGCGRRACYCECGP